MILLWGLMEDSPLSAVGASLDEMQADWDFVDQRQTLSSTITVELEGKVRGHIATPDGNYNLEEISSLYWRQYDFEKVLGLGEKDRGSEPWRKAAHFEESLTILAEHLPGMVVNRPSSTGSNNSKPYQLEVIRNAGLAVPDTLISSEPKAVIEFWEKHGSIIYKSISSCRSIVAQFQEQDLASLSAITCCPTQFQQYIKGTDYRVHVIGERAFAHRIVCQSDDYRYSSNAEIEHAELPDVIAQRCIRVTQQLGLEFSGVDLRRSVNDEWVCFEINPSPGFTYFDRENQLAHALAQHLTR